MPGIAYDILSYAIQLAQPLHVSSAHPFNHVIELFKNGYLGCAESVAVHGLSLVLVCGLLTAVASLVAEHGLWSAWAQYLWRPGLAASQHMASS